MSIFGNISAAVTIISATVRYGTNPQQLPRDVRYTQNVISDLTNNTPARDVVFRKASDWAADHVEDAKRNWSDLLK